MNPLDQIDALKAELDVHRPLDPHFVKMLQGNYRVRLTYHSTAIGGSALTQSETQVLLERGLAAQGKPLRHHLKAEDHAFAFDYIEQLSAGEFIHEREIRGIHALVSSRSDRDIGGHYRSISVPAAGDVHCYPDATLVSGLMTTFDQWLNAPTDLHPVDFAAEAHYQFIEIHFITGKPNPLVGWEG